MPGSTNPTIANGKPKVADGPRRVEYSKAEFNDGNYSVPNLQMALEGLHQDGMVILKGIVDVDHCNKIYDHMVGDRDRILETRHKDAIEYNQGVKCR